MRNHSCTVRDFFPPPAEPINNDMFVSIQGPTNLTFCDDGESYIAEIFNNLGTTPHTFLWERSSNGITDWCQVGGNSPTISEQAIKYGGCGGGNFFLRVTVTDSSVPNMIASSSRHIQIIPCGPESNTKGSDELSAEVRESFEVEEIEIYPNPAKSFINVKNLSKFYILSNLGIRYEPRIHLSLIHI